MQTPPATWLPSLVFGAGVALGTALGFYAPLSPWYGLCAALLYGVALALAGVIEQRRAFTIQTGNKPLEDYLRFSVVALLVAAVFAPGWLPALIPAFAVEGVGLLRQSPRCTTKKFNAWWKQVRK